MTMFLCLDITKFLESHGIKTTNVDSSLVQQHIQQHSVHRGINPTSQKHPPSYLLKVTKFLVKISQFEFLVTTEKYFCLKTFFAIKYFRF